jgi:DNA invertase Pin-like site-specific DNA recombinase
VASSALATLAAFNVTGVLIAGVLTDRLNRARLLAAIYFARMVALLLLPVMTTPRLLFVFAVMFGLAEIESEYRRERQAAGIHVARKEGLYKGRQKGTMKAEPARAKALHNQGLTVAEIANAMAVSKRTVFRYLAEVLSA